MKFFSYFSSVALAGLFLVGCAGEDATLEEARYLLGKGDASSGAKAHAMVDSLRSSSDPKVKFEAIRIYAGGKAAEAGFSSAQIISSLVHKEDDDEFVDLMENALSGLNESEAAGLMAEAETALLAAVGSTNAGDIAITGAAVSADSDFSNLSTEVQNELIFQLGLIRFLEAARISLSSSGLLGDTSFTAADCEAEFDFDEANDGALNLENARQNLLATRIDDSNQMVDVIEDFQAEVDPDQNGLAGEGADTDDQDEQAARIEDYCDALAQQSAD